MKKQMSRMGIIIKNTKGEMITTRSNIRETKSPLQAESESALMGIRIANALGVKKIIIEGDSLVIIQALQEPLEECLKEIKICIADCKNLLPNFDSIVFNHASRLKNKLADKLAKEGSQGQANGGNVIPPYLLYEDLTKDMSSCIPPQL